MMLVTDQRMKPIDVNRLSEAQLDWLVHVGQGGDPSTPAARIPAYTTTQFLMVPIIRRERIETERMRHSEPWSATINLRDFEGHTELIAAAKAYAAWRFRMSCYNMLLVPATLD